MDLEHNPTPTPNPTTGVVKVPDKPMALDDKTKVDKTYSKKTGLNSVTLDVQKVQTYLDCALGENNPFQSVTQRCQTASCLANKLAVHSVYREYNVYISFFLHRFIRFVEMQMHDQRKDQMVHVSLVRSGYSIVQEYTNGMGQQWQFTRDQPMADRVTMQSPEPDLHLYHMEIITPSHPELGYGSALLIAQRTAALIIPFDKIVTQACYMIPWHEMVWQVTDDAKVIPKDAMVDVLALDNPMLSLLWLHAALHLGGDVITTVKQQSHTELNGMAMYELQLTDMLVPHGPINDILAQYEQERVDHAATVSLSLTTPNPETVPRKWW